MRERAQEVAISNPEYSDPGILPIIIIILAIAAIVAVAYLYNRDYFIKKKTSSSKLARGSNNTVAQAGFCPNCGNKLPAGASFCNKCGAQLGSRQTAGQATAVQTAKSIGAASGSIAGFTPTGIAGRVAAVITAICMFLPWASVPALNTMSGYASQIGIGSGGGYDYSIPGLGDPVNTLTYMLGSNSLKTIHTLFMVVWVIALILLAVGLVLSLIGQRKSSLLVGGCLVAAVVAIAWAVFVPILNSANNFELLSVAGGCISTIVFAALGFVLSLVGRQKA